MVLNGIIFIYVYFLNVTFILFFKVLQRAIKELLDKGITKNQTLARKHVTRTDATIFPIQISEVYVCPNKREIERVVQGQGNSRKKGIDFSPTLSAIEGAAPDPLPQTHRRRGKRAELL